MESPKGQENARTASPAAIPRFMFYVLRFTFYDLCSGMFYALYVFFNVFFCQSHECVVAVTQRLQQMGIAGHQTTAGAERQVDRAQSLMANLTQKVRVSLVYT